MALDYHNSERDIRDESIGERTKLYSEQFALGYRWVTNSPVDRVESDRIKYASQGFEVFIHDVAIMRNGKVWAGAKAVLTRKRRLELGL